MSFPSGHTCMGALLFVGGAIVLTVQSERATRVLAVGAAMVWTALIAWSRLLLGYHWMTDLVGSVLLATSLLLPLAWLVQAPRPPYGDAGHVERAELVERAEHVEQAEHADSAPDPA